jgi:hypothetical protein
MPSRKDVEIITTEDENFISYMLLLLAQKNAKFCLKKKIIFIEVAKHLRHKG